MVADFPDADDAGDAAWEGCGAGGVGGGMQVPVVPCFVEEEED